jgi:hemoglobin
MDPRPDIRSRADIDALVEAFYRKALVDDVIGFIFTDVAKIDLEKHLPLIADFWDSILFGSSVYAQHGHSPILVHALLHKKQPLTEEHFNRWLTLFSQTVDELFSGAVAEEAKQRARGIAGFMQKQINSL